jgi:hypothetical protein
MSNYLCPRWFNEKDNYQNVPPIPRKIKSINSLILGIKSDDFDIEEIGESFNFFKENIDTSFNPYTFHNEILKKKISGGYLTSTYNNSVPHWLTKKELFLLYEETDYLHQIIPLFNLNKEDDLKRPGEHLFHQTYIMILGDWLLHNHYVKDKGSPKLLIEYVEKILAIPKDEKCKGCGKDCVVFAWQLISLLHDIGYRVALSYDLLRYFDNLRVAKTNDQNFNYLHYIFPEIDRYFNLFNNSEIHQKVYSHFDENEGIKDTWHKYVESYRNISAYSFFNHPFYGLHLMKLYYSIHFDKMPECFRKIYTLVFDGIALHHLPVKNSSNIDVPFSWKFEERPLTYLLRILDEIKIWISLSIRNGNYINNREVENDGTGIYKIKGTEIQFKGGKYEIEINSLKEYGPLRIGIPLDPVNDKIKKEQLSVFYNDPIFPVEFFSLL